MITMDHFKQSKDALSKKFGEIHVDSVIIETGNKLESLYYKDEELHKLRSCSKLLVAMAIGLAIDNKMAINGIPLNLETRIYPVIKDLVSIRSTENLKKIERWTVRNLLTHTAGYDKQMLSGALINDVDKNELLDYAVNFGIPHEVGARYAYNNAEPFILSAFFQEAFNINLTDFVSENIFKPLGIEYYRWDNFGKYCPGGTGLYLKHSDFHKIGQLLIHGGKYGTIDVVPSSWVAEMCLVQTEALSAFKPNRVLPKLGAGYFTFTSRDGFVFRDGSAGQYLIVNRDRDLLITILSSEPDMKNVSEILRGFI